MHPGSGTEPAPNPPAAPEAENENDELQPPKPLKRLQDLEWPEEPDSSLWADPLNRDELKPLRNFELEAIGKAHFILRDLKLTESPAARNQELRTLLKDTPILPELLQQAFSDPSMPPEVYLRHIMGISTASTSTTVATQSYRGRGRGRGARGQPRGRGRGGIRISRGEAAAPPSPETIATMQKFADLVSNILSQARQSSAPASTST